MRKFCCGGCSGVSFGVFLEDVFDLFLLCFGDVIFDVLVREPARDVVYGCFCGNEKLMMRDLEKKSGYYCAMRN